jgi:hypothetical protein
MTTKAPSHVQPASASAAETIAYAAVAGIPTVEPHDRDRLGYCVWLWLTTHRDTLEQAVRSANARLTVSHEEALKTIRDRLRESGVTV